MCPFALMVIFSLPGFCFGVLGEAMDDSGASFHHHLFKFPHLNKMLLLIPTEDWGESRKESTDHGVKFLTLPILPK